MYILFKFLDRFTREVVLIDRILIRDTRDLQNTLRRLHRIAGRSTVYEIADGGIK
jgi:hypothetical protein